MGINTRLTKVLENSPKIPFDNSSRIIIMSDCHRGVGGRSDNFLDNHTLYIAALNYYYDRGYTYIELGDGDELWENRNMNNISQIHNNVFWILSQFYRSGRFYMLYGNHDIVKKDPRFFRMKCKSFYCDSLLEHVDFFPGLSIYEGLYLQYSDTPYGIFLTHGHQADFINDQLWRLSRFLVRYVWQPLEIIGIHDPTSAAKNYEKRNMVEKRLVEWSRKEHQMLICGHTHRPVYPKKGEPLYFNDGSCVHPHSITGIEISNGTISLVKWSTKTKPDRTLYVGREVLEGPDNLIDLFTSPPINQ